NSFSDERILLGTGTVIIFSLLLYSIFRFANIIEIDQNENKIVFRKPAILRKATYKFSEVKGFSFSQYHARGIFYRVIKIKTLNSTYYLSDFETKNFNELETLLVENFTLLDQDGEAISIEKQAKEFHKRKIQKQNQN